jgi:RNA recognition motif-containing protein
MSKVSKGFGYVVFASFEESKKAMEQLDGQRLLSKPIELSYASWKGTDGSN